MIQDNNTPESLGHISTWTAGMFSIFHLLGLMGRWGAWIVLLASLLITFNAWYFIRGEVTKRAQARFDFRVKTIETGIYERLQAYEFLLQGGSGLFAISDEVTREDWRTYILKLQINQYYPGIQGVGFSKLILPSEKEAHLRQIRGEGFPQYTIKPEGDRPEYTSIIFLEPFDWRNQRAFGYDMFSEPIRKEAMIRTRDTGIAALSGKVTLVQETINDIQAGFLIYLAVYRKGGPLETPEQRSEALLGYVYSPFRINEFMKGILDEKTGYVNLQIFDGEKPLKETLLYRSDTTQESYNDPKGSHFATAQSILTYAGHHWLLSFVSTKYFEKNIETGPVKFILLLGITISLLLFGMVLSLTKSSRQAVSLANTTLDLEKANIGLRKEITERKQVEDALKKNESLFRGLHDNMTSGSAIYDVINDGSKGSDYITKSFNKKSLDLEGKTMAQVVGKSLFELRPNIDDYGLIPVMKKVWETGNPEYFPVKIYQDETFSNYYENFIFKIPSGEVVTIYNDVTDRKNAEDALIKSESHLRILVDTIPDLIWLKDSDGVYMSCNLTFELFFGAKESLIVGKTDYDFMDKDLANFSRENDRRTMEQGQASINEEWLNFSDDGYSGLFETVKTPMRNPDGKIIGVLGIARDITDRKKNEDLLKQNEHRYKSAQRMGKVGNWEYDLVTETFWGSDQAKQIYGVDPDSKEFTIDEIENCIPERERVHQALIDLIEKDKPYNLEFDIHPVSGSEKRKIRSDAEIIKDDSGSPLKVLGVIQDITDQKKAEQEKKKLEQELRQAQKMESIGTLAGGIAHDFNNILYPIIGFAELSLQDLPENHPVKENLEDILQGAKRARDLVKQILAFSSQREEEQKPLILTPLIQEALKLLRSIIPSNIDIQQQFYDTTDCVIASSIEIHEIVMNLCTNAYHAMEKTGGTLSIQLNDAKPDPKLNLPHDDYCCLSISDTGIGIPPEIINKVFDPYFTTKEQGKGSGLGLSVVHGIIKKNNGAVIVESTPGKGTVFKIFLPITSATKKSDEALNVQSNPGGDENILFVDDEVAIVKLGVRLLEKLGYKVTGKSSSVEALALFKSAPGDFDLVITDITMPEMVGTELAAKLLETRPDIPVILCTGFSERVDIETISSLDINGYIHKPILSADLYSKVRDVLDKSKKG